MRTTAVRTSRARRCSKPAGRSCSSTTARSWPGSSVKARATWSRRTATAGRPGRASGRRTRTGRASGVVSTFVRFHPLLAHQQGAPIHVEQLAPTVAWRVEPERDLLAGLHFNHRNKVRKAENAGATGTQHDGLGEFVELYEDTMRRIDADHFYLFEPAYWERLGELPLARFDAVIDGDLVASALCLPSKPWLHYHLSGTTDKGRETGSSTLVLLEAARWAQANGYERFHLGGGLGGKADYRELSGGEAGYEGFFPAYRGSSG